MTPTDARKITLHELIEWCDKQMELCESKEDNWVVIGNEVSPYHGFKIESNVEITYMDRTCAKCHIKGNPDYWQWIEKSQLENRKHLDTTRYQAFKDMKDKCNELMNSISVAA